MSRTFTYMPGSSTRLRIGHAAAERHRAGGRVHAVVGEIERALLVVERAVGAQQPHFGQVALRERHVARGLRALQPLEVGRRLIEEHVDGIDLLDGS